MEHTITYHVVPHEEGWAVKKEGHDVVAFSADSKDEALAWGRKQAQARFARLIIHDDDGTFKRHRDCSDGPVFIQKLADSDL